MAGVSNAFFRSPIGGACITLFVISGYWGGNRYRLGYENIWPTTLLILLSYVLIAILLRFICRDWTRAGLAAIFIAFYVFYMHAILSIMKFSFAVEAIFHISAILFVYFLYRKITKDKDIAGSVLNRLNLVCFLLLLIFSIPVVFGQWKLEKDRPDSNVSIGELSAEPNHDTPDVWHIIFDRYASNETLRKHYNFDNGAFMQELRDRDFIIQPNAYSNYQRTSHSVASTLNGGYLDKLSNKFNGVQSDWVPIYRSMVNSSSIRLFQKLNYHTVFAGSWWEPTRFSPIADENVLVRSVPQLARLIFEKSSLGFWLKGFEFPYLNERNDQCYRVNEKFRKLKELAGSSERKYVFAHFLVPHPPFVLNEDGSCRSLEKATNSSREDNYVGQVKFTNTEAISLIDSILAGPRPAIIIMHSDEGPWPDPYVGNEHGLGTDPVYVPWGKLSESQLKEKMGIILVVRYPKGEIPKNVPQSPVQIYPAILKGRFGYDGNIPESRHYLFDGDKDLYKFTEVVFRD